MVGKYGAEPTVVDGARFHSKREARRWAELQLLQRAGEIRDLKRQVRIELGGDDWPIRTPTGRRAAYVADFTYFSCGLGVPVIEDSKGAKTDVYLLKKAILAAMGLTIRET